MRTGFKAIISYDNAAIRSNDVYLINRVWWDMYMKLYEALLQNKNSFTIDVFNWKSKKQPIPKDHHYNGPAVATSNLTVVYMQLEAG